LPARIAPDGSLLASGIALRLDRLIEVLAHAGRQAQFLPQDAPPAPAPALPGDHGVAALAGLAMASAILLYCAVWILLAWPNGATMAAFAAIITGSFAAQDDPAPAIDRYLVATLKTYPLSAFILFVVLPRIDGYAMLMLAIAPPLLWMGYIQADPRRSPQALPMFSCFIVAQPATALCQRLCRVRQHRLRTACRYHDDTGHHAPVPFDGRRVDGAAPPAQQCRRSRRSGGPGPSAADVGMDRPRPRPHGTGCPAPPACRARANGWEPPMRCSTCESVPASSACATGSALAALSKRIWEEC
jgi:hypothetical protein